ncbi:MAG TPA: hypothetical protein VNT52_03410, partial [Acidimicrobiales bacterium]|nr:hypothetical protein [Acidimicrobiales bacterium]
VEVMTAEGRLSGIVLAVLPVGVAAMLYASNRAYIGVLFSEPLGRVMLAGAGVLALAGFLWIRKTTAVTL